MTGAPKRDADAAMAVHLRRVDTRTAELLLVLERLEDYLGDRGAILSMRQYVQLAETLSLVGIAGARILEADLYRDYRIGLDART